MAWDNPSKGVQGSHIYDSLWVSVDLGSCSAGTENSGEDWLGAVGAGFLGMETFLGFEQEDSDHSPAECEADTGSGEKYCFAVVGFGDTLTAGNHHPHTS